ncbi:hypothetical protein TNCV_2443361 [Trichonephila clavipes]|nr:hypothetical protein TNCV_2443361 [Trichonephila clavipes]
MNFPLTLYIEFFHYPPPMEPPCPGPESSNRTKRIVAWFDHSCLFLTLQHHYPPTLCDGLIAISTESPFGFLWARMAILSNQLEK